MVVEDSVSVTVALSSYGAYDGTHLLTHSRSGWGEAGSRADTSMFDAHGDNTRSNW